MESETQKKTASFNLVLKLAELDSRFVPDYAPDIADAKDFPHGIMVSYAQFLCHRFQDFKDSMHPLLLSTMKLLEEALRADYQEVQNIIEVSFIEPVFYGNKDLFTWMLDHASDYLKYEMLAFQTTERGYRLINAVRETFGQTPLSSMQAMMENQTFVERLADLKIPVEERNALDAWMQPFKFRLESGKNVMSIVSLGSLRGYGRDIDIRG